MKHRPSLLLFDDFFALQVLITHFTISAVFITLSFNQLSQFSALNLIKFEFFFRLNLLFCFVYFLYGFI
jgi:hypothetical protein